jgi:uncharacterized protein YoaH (UPF0181 family)
VRTSVKKFTLFACRFCGVRGVRSAIRYLMDEKAYLRTKRTLLQFLHQEALLSRPNASRDLKYAISHGWLEVDENDVVQMGISLRAFLDRNDPPDSTPCADPEPRENPEEEILEPICDIIRNNVAQQEQSPKKEQPPQKVAPEAAPVRTAEDIIHDLVQTISSAVSSNRFWKTSDVAHACIPSFRELIKSGMNTGNAIESIQGTLRRYHKLFNKPAKFFAGGRKLNKEGIPKNQREFFEQLLNNVGNLLLNETPRVEQYQQYPEYFHLIRDIEEEWPISDQEVANKITLRLGDAPLRDPELLSRLSNKIGLPEPYLRTLVEQFL